MNDVSDHEATILFPYSPEKWLYNRMYCPSNRFKQIQETHMAYSVGTQYTRQSLNEKQHTWLHKQTVIVCEAMYVVFHSNFAAYIVCQSHKPCEFPGFVWTYCWGNKSYYVITSPANTGMWYGKIYGPRDWTILFHTLKLCSYPKQGYCIFPKLFHDLNKEHLFLCLKRRQ